MPRMPAQHHEPQPRGSHPLPATGEEPEMLARVFHPQGVRDLTPRSECDLARSGKPRGVGLPCLTMASANAVAPRHVRRAEAYMRRNIIKSITIAELAREVCVSVRALQSGFRRFRGATPLETLRGLRLEAARADLQRADVSDTVTGIALRWGFTHLSRFSQSYKARFGELPLQTLRKR